MLMKRSRRAVVRELGRAAAAGTAPDFRYWDLRGADLSGLSLAGADFTRADLRAADVSRSDLAGAQMLRARLGHARFRASDLSGAQLMGVDAERADFSHADLSHVEFELADLRDANFWRTCLFRVGFRGALWSPRALGSAEGLSPSYPAHFISEAEWGSLRTWQGQQRVMPGGLLVRRTRDEVVEAARVGRRGAMAGWFTYADLSGLDLSGLDLSRMEFPGASFAGTNLSGTDLSGADLNLANLKGANLAGTNFRGAYLLTARCPAEQLLDARGLGPVPAFPDHPDPTSWMNNQSDLDGPAGQEPWGIKWDRLLPKDPEVRNLAVAVLEDWDGTLREAIATAELLHAA